MTRHSHLNLDDFPDSPYARELRQGVSTRPFAPQIEGEYVAEHLQRVHLRVRIWFSLVACMAVGFTFVNIRATGLWSFYTLLHLVLLVPALAMLLLVWTRWYDHYFMPAVRILVPVMVSVAAVSIAQGVTAGQALAVTGLVLNILAAYFFAGLLFRAALVASGTMLFVYGLAAIMQGMPLELGFSGLVVMLVTAAIAGVVQRDIEISHRQNFLEGVLIRDLVARDALTGVMNRRAFDEHLRRVWQQALRDRRPLALLLIDIDHFKSYNDCYGHQAGDVALRRVAQILQSFARRPLDLAARYGGEEFAVIFYDPAPAQLSVVTEQMRHAVEKLGITHNAPSAGPVVTISIGVGVVQPAIERTVQGAVQFADEALYQAKEAGRNRVVMRGSDEYCNLQTGAFNGPRTIRLIG